MEPVTISVDDFMKAVGLGKTKTFELIKSGELETVKVGTRRLIKTSSIRRLIGEAA